MGLFKQRKGGLPTKQLEHKIPPTTLEMSEWRQTHKTSTGDSQRSKRRTNRYGDI